MTSGCRRAVSEIFALLGSYASSLVKQCWSAWLGLLGPSRWDRQVVSKPRYLSINLRCITSPKSVDLRCIRTLFLLKVTNDQYKYICYFPLNFIAKKAAFCSLHKRFLSYWNQDWDGRGMKCEKYVQNSRKPKHKRPVVRLENNNGNILNKYGVGCMRLPHDMGQYHFLDNI